MLALSFVGIYSTAIAQELKFQNIAAMEALNSEYEDFAPCFDRFRHVLYFNSVRAKYSYFYQSKYKENGFELPTILQGEINQQFKHQSYLSILNEDQAVYSAYNLLTDRSYINLYNIYYKKGMWSKPTLLDSISGSQYSAQASVHPDANYLVFSTIRNTQETDSDIWIAYRQSDGSWGDLAPIDAINSPGDEITPYLKSADTLFFASNGLGGPGGFDLYRSVKIDGVWQRPFPLRDLNTEFDESDICFINSDTCIFASNRPGGIGGLDLYIATVNTNTDQQLSETDLNLSLSSTIYLVKVESELNTEYHYDTETRKFNKAVNINTKYFPNELELQFIAKPSSIVASAQALFEIADDNIYTYQLHNATEDFTVKFTDIFKDKKTNTGTMIVKVQVLTRGNFTIEKQIEINFSAKEIVNHRPFRVNNNYYAKISLNTSEIEDEIYPFIQQILKDEYANEIIIKMPSIIDVKSGKLVHKLKNSFQNIKVIENTNNSNSLIELYFR